MSPVHDWVLIMRSHCDGLPKRVYTWFLWRFQGDFKLDFIRGRCPLGSTKSRGHRRRKKRVLVTFRTWQFCWSPFWGWWKHDPKSMAICYLQRSGIKRSLCLNHLAWIKATPQLQINLVMFVFFFWEKWENAWFKHFTYDNVFSQFCSEHVWVLLKKVPAERRRSSCTFS